MELLEDPLDRDDFDPVQYLNERFPTEASLEELDPFVADISARITSVDDEISRTVQSQSVIGRQATKDLEEAKQYIEDLFVKISDIKKKASESESMVQDLCADIKKLDYAKNHLQTSITSLNRLQMLINAVNQLETLADDGHFKEAANLLDAVKQFMGHFEQYKNISVIADLVKRIDRIKKDLTKQIKRIFSDLAQNVDTVADVELALNIPGGLRAAADACLVVDALGHKVRKELLEDFVQRQLVQYESLFGQNKEYYSIDQFERRWAWFKRLLKHIDAKFTSMNIFPSHWRIELRMLLAFIESTKMHLIMLLTDMETSNEAADVHGLLRALQSTIKFEQEMSERFNLLKELRQQEEKDQQQAQAQQNIPRGKEAENQLKLKQNDKLMYIPTDHSAVNKDDETESGFLTLANSVINGGMSSVFDKFLSSYVTLEKNNLADLLSRLGQEEDTAGQGQGDRGSNGNVYGSSTNMFVFIKNSIKRCIALTNGQTFFALSEEFRSCMRKYVVMLKNRCPPEISSNPPSFRIPADGEMNICYLINTGEYCAEVVPQLEQMIQQKIQPTLANKVNFQEEADAFMDLVAYCLKVLVYGVVDRLDAGFRAMQGINWGSFEMVGEESSYLRIFQGVLLETIPKIRTALSSSYFSNFCTKLATELLSRFADVIVKQKRISDMGTQQLLMDTYSMKTLMLQLPNLHSGEISTTITKSTSPVYVKLINAKATHVEVILKLVGTPDDMLLERFRVMWPDGQPADLQLLMALKGTKRADQQVLLEMLGLSGKQNSKSGNASVQGAANNSGNSATTATASLASATAQYTAASAAASVAAFSSMKSLTQDLSSQARSAVGNLKWGTNK